MATADMDDTTPADTPPAPRTQGQRRDAARARMLAAAMQLISQGGAARLNLVDVGREAGYSHALPHYHFKNKVGLLLAVYHHISDTAGARVKAWLRRRRKAPVPPGLDTIEASIRAYLGLAAGDPTPSRVMNVLWSESASSIPELADTVRATSRSYLAQHEDQLRQAIARGEVDPAVDVASMAVLVLALQRGLAFQQLLDPSGVDLGRVADVAVSLVRRGLAHPDADPAVARRTILD